MWCGEYLVYIRYIGVFVLYVTQNYSENLRYLESFTKRRGESDSLMHGASSKYNGDIENILFQKRNA